MPDAFDNFWFLLFGMITVIIVVITLARAWVVTHRTSAKLAFEAQLLQRDLSVDDIERLMVASAYSKHRRGSPSTTPMSEDSLNEVVSVLGQVGASPAVIEEVLWAFRSIDAPTQEILSQAMQFLISSAQNEVTGEQLLAIVRPLCQPKETANDSVVPIRDERIRQDA